MLIKYRGRDPKDRQPVDIPGADGVAPGDVVDVDEAVGVSLLAAGASHHDNGDVEPAAWACWVPAAKTEAKAAAKTDTADPAVTKED